MTITLTKDELETFTSRLREWNMKMVDYVFSHAKLTIDGRLGYSPRVDNLHEIKERFIKENPEPNWKSLL